MEQFYEHIIKQGIFELEISKVDGIIVDCYIKVFRTQDGPETIELQITKDSHMLYKDRVYPANYQGFQTLMERFSELKFDKKSGLFCIIKPEKYENCYKFDNIVLNIQECCVCLEATRTRTQCHHHLCWICYDKLTRKRCPLCRNCLVCDDCESDDE
jgi:hypothetical protein